ncbi:endoglucanase [Symbiobacterium terraclitae]|uniref:Endoglucanase n=1 Tax=Symbiobacterium terraclitae TaxID=557451 RepID=A0ABS4JQV8_9FIRM|nr:endoglucanase [Symbiobacterium terraclitae]
MDQRLKMYEELTSAYGVPGFEEPVRQVMRKYLEPLSDEIIYDNLGSIAGVKRGKAGGPRIMVAGHLDEVGWMVTQITDKGFLKLQPLGGWWSQVMLSQRVKVLTRKGELVGVIGSKPPHALSQEERNKVVQIKDMFVDIGASSRDEAKEWGVRPGDPVVPHCDFHVMPNPKILLNKAWDNRAGCAAAIMVLEELKGQEHPNEVYAVGNVQEEVGLRGATTMANTIEPDIAFALDVGIAGDVPGSDGQYQGNLGEGPLIVVYDASMVPHRGLRDLVIDTAEELNIPLQFQSMAGGGTDAGKMHLFGRGVPSLAIGFATRYIHSHVSLIHRDDMENAAKLVAAVIKKLDADTVAQLRRYV